MTLYQLAKIGILGSACLVIVGALVAGWLAAESPRRGRGVRFSRRSALAAIATAAVLGALASAAGVVLLRGHWFGLIRLAYLLLTLVPAAIGLAALLAGLLPRVETCKTVRTLGVIGLLPGVLALYVSFIAPYQLQLEHATHSAPRLPATAAPLRIVVLADIQTDTIGEYEHRAVDRALAQAPDIIVLPGDFLQGPPNVVEPLVPKFRELMRRLKAPGGVYACAGNIDWAKDRNRNHGSSDPDAPVWTRQLFEDTPVQLLFNEVATVELRGARVAIGGVEFQFFEREAVDAIRALGNTPADVRILLCHTPNGVLRCEQADEIDLLIAGHTHGGQVQIPGFGTLMNVADFVPRAVAGGGLHRAHDQWLYVSRGVGFERGLAPPMRLFCPPEVSVLELRPD